MPDPLLNGRWILAVDDDPTAPQFNALNDSGSDSRAYVPVIPVMLLVVDMPAYQEILVIVGPLSQGITLGLVSGGS